MGRFMLVLSVEISSRSSSHTRRVNPTAFEPRRSPVAHSSCTALSKFALELIRTMSAGRTAWIEHQVLESPTARTAESPKRRSNLKPPAAPCPPDRPQKWQALPSGAECCCSGILPAMPVELPRWQSIRVRHNRMPHQHCEAPSPADLTPCAPVIAMSLPALSLQPDHRS